MHLKWVLTPGLQKDIKMERERVIRLEGRNRRTSLKFFGIPEVGDESSAKSWPCIRLVRGKLELTNPDSAGGENFTFLTSMQVNWRGIEIRQLFSQEMVLVFH